MTGSRVEQGPHIADGDLIRLLDSECSPAEAQQMRAHIDVCSECSNNADSLRQASELFSSSLAELDTQLQALPARWVTNVGTKLAGSDARLRVGSPRVWRAAAVLAAMVLVFTATPARALFVRGWEALKSLVVSEPPALPTEVETLEVAGPEMSSVLRFTPRRSEFHLEFTETPEDGTLFLLFDSVATASAGVIGEDSADEMILLPNGLRVRNSSRSTASYEVRLPLTLSVVEVSIAGNAVLRLDLRSQSVPFRREVSLPTGAGD